MRAPTLRSGGAGGARTNNAAVTPMKNRLSASEPNNSRRGAGAAGEKAVDAVLIVRFSLFDSHCDSHGRTPVKASGSNATEARSLVLAANGPPNRSRLV